MLGAIGGTWQEASVKGYLKAEGWGSKMGFPGIILNESGDAIAGHIFHSESLDEHWTVLDEFEGEEYQRVMTEARTKGVSTVPVYIYVLRYSEED